MNTIFYSIHNRLYPSSRQTYKVSTLLLQRGATEHSSTRPRLPSHHLLNVSQQLANKLGNLKKKKKIRNLSAKTSFPTVILEPTNSCVFSS
jgi:hypothetical protein